MASMTSAPGTPASLAEWARGAQIFEAWHLPSQDQQFIGGCSTVLHQGMRFMWAFNHDEARAHSPAPRNWTPQCGICLWVLR